MNLSRITIPFSTRVHTDHIRNFDVEYWIDVEMDMFMDGGLPHELINDATEFRRIVSRNKVSGNNIKDAFDNYICDEGLFFEK